VHEADEDGSGKKPGNGGNDVGVILVAFCSKKNSLRI
jgi:hypothetical protein